MALEGTLQDMSLSDLFQIFRMGPKTGVLLLVAGDDRGVVYVAEGRVIDAALVRGTDRTVLATQDEAVLQMLTWEAASFVFRHDPAAATRQVRIGHDAEWLVLEGMRRRQDPARAMPYQRITLDTQLQLSPLPSSAESGVSLDVNQWRILSQIASCPNLRAICEATGIPANQAIRTVAELMAIGLVELVIPPPPAARPKPAAPRHDPAASGSAGKPLEPAPGPGPKAALGEADERPQIGRGLLDAIMRRVRAL